MERETLIDLLFEVMNKFRGFSMHNNIYFARQNNLSMSQMGTMFRLHRNGPTGVSQIGSELGISSAAVSQMLERLVQQGLVQRTEAPNDRRAKVIDLTPLGRQMVDEVHGGVRRSIMQVIFEMDNEEAQKVSEALTLILKKVEENELKVEIEEETREF